MDEKHCDHCNNNNICKVYDAYGNFIEKVKFTMRVDILKSMRSETLTTVAKSCQNWKRAK